VVLPDEEELPDPEEDEPEEEVPEEEEELLLLPLPEEAEETPTTPGMARPVGATLAPAA